ncbi:MAG: OmpA family protein, partial [Saprospiraceae bacterium]|nr:OmpA family protein [Saprospiraceae bacterium]
MKKNAIARRLPQLLFCFLFSNTLGFAQSVILSKTVYFEKASIEITAEQRMVLAALADSSASKDKYHVVIKGHTDSDGDSTYNEMLSIHRALAVKAYLLTKGIDSSAVILQGLGERQPLMKNLTEAGKARNRRVEIQFTFEQSKLLTQSPTQSSMPADGLATLYEKLLPKPNIFCVDPAKDTILRCSLGTLFHLKANAFKLPEGPPAKCLTIKVVEAYRLSEMLFANLSTTSNGNLLETSGMLHFSAFDEKGNELDLVNGKAVTAFVPTDSVDENLQIFKGVQSTAYAGINWLVDEQSKLASFDLKNINEYSAGSPPDWERCPFFFCKLEKFWARLTGKPLPNPTVGFNKLAELEKEYGVSDLKALAKALGVDNSGEDRLFSGKVLEAGIKKRLESGKANIADMQYYVFNLTGTGWRNCDIFMNKPPESLIQMEVLAGVDSNMKVQLVFKKLRAIVDAHAINGKYF